MPLRPDWYNPQLFIFLFAILRPCLPNSFSKEQNIRCWQKREDDTKGKKLRANKKANQEVSFCRFSLRSEDSLIKKVRKKKARFSRQQISDDITEYRSRIQRQNTEAKTKSLFVSEVWFLNSKTIQCLSFKSLEIPLFLKEAVETVERVFSHWGL